MCEHLSTITLNDQKIDVSLKMTHKILYFSVDQLAAAMGLAVRSFNPYRRSISVKRRDQTWYYSYSVASQHVLCMIMRYALWELGVEFYTVLQQLNASICAEYDPDTLVLDNNGDYGFLNVAKCELINREYIDPVKSHSAIAIYSWVKQFWDDIDIQDAHTALKEYMRLRNFLLDAANRYVKSLPAVDYEQREDTLMKEFRRVLRMDVELKGPEMRAYLERRAKSDSLFKTDAITKTTESAKAAASAKPTIVQMLAVLDASRAEIATLIANKSAAEMQNLFYIYKVRTIMNKAHDTASNLAKASIEEITTNLRDRADNLSKLVDAKIEKLKVDIGYADHVSEPSNKEYDVNAQAMRNYIDLKHANYELEAYTELANEWLEMQEPLFSPPRDMLFKQFQHISKKIQMKTIDFDALMFDRGYRIVVINSYACWMR